MADEGDNPRTIHRSRTEKELRAMLSTLCQFVWYRTTRPGEHLWSIPVDKERDFDCMFSDAISELVQARAALAETRDALHQLTEAFERRLGEFEITPDALNKAKELLSRRDTPGSSNAIVSQPPLGDTSTDR